MTSRARKRKKRPVRVLRQGELRGNRKRTREALALVWDEISSSGSQRFVIRLDEKEPAHA